MEHTDTIAAIATPAGEGGIAVVRLSGPEAFAIADRLWKGKSIAESATHTAHLGIITDEKGESLDQAVATIFRAPRSFTGEDTVEFSIHGGRWLQQAVLGRICECGARVAGPGEFSRRAFINGRLDLAQAEGVADLIAAESKAAARLAISQATGSFSSNLNKLRDSLIDFACMLELELDFSEEEVEFADRRHLMELCTKAHDTITKLAKSFKAGKMYKDGIPAVIAGKPNAGKSTLLNRLSEDDLAIVSDIPGTTRDVIEARIEIGGTLFRFYDTAGLRAEADEIEAQGIERARRKISQCSLLLWMVDATTLSDDDSLEEALPFGPNGECDTLNEECSIYILLNKIDLIDQQSANRIMESCHKLAEKEDHRIVLLPISASEGEGIAELESRIETEFCLHHNEEAAMTVSNVRHYESLVKAERAISRAAEGIEAGISADFIAQDVRETTDALSSITGTISAPDLLQTIFSRFCIGK